jgi:hypothetical protein
VSLPAGSRIHDVISIVHLRKFNGTSDILPLPIEVEVAGENDHIVERIDGECINSDGIKEYLIKWEGYSDLERMWEPTSHLDHAVDVIKDWIARHPRYQTPQLTLSTRNLLLSEEKPSATKEVRLNVEENCF